MKINEVYKSGKSKDLVAAIDSEFSNYEKDALIFHGKSQNFKFVFHSHKNLWCTVRSALNALDLICDHFHSSMAGFGTKEYILSCDIIRYQGAFTRIAQHYQQKYKAILKKRILEETSAEYQKLLESILNAPASQASGA